mgnify:CR=1 FL=1
MQLHSPHPKPHRYAAGRSTKCVIMRSVKIARALSTFVLVALLPIAACSDSDSNETTVAHLSPSAVADACQQAVIDDIRAEGLSYDVLSVYGFDVPEDLIRSDGTFEGQLTGTLQNDEYIGKFTFDCATDGSTAQVGNYNFAEENFLADRSTSASRPTENTPTRRPRQQSTEQTAPVDPQRIDPQHNGAGRSGRDDNLGIYYHNRENFRFLEQPGKIVPGGRIYNTRKNSGCSTGFIASRDNRAFIITAGHCGDIGDQFVVQDRQGNTLLLGEMVESYVEQSGEAITGADIGLIELYDDAKQHVDSSLPVNAKIQGVISPAEAAQREMAICRLGATTGYSCGVFVDEDQAGQFHFRNISDRGDSGGAIFAFDGTNAYALGVVSRGSDYNKTLAGGMSIGEAVQYWGLTVHS